MVPGTQGYAEQAEELILRYESVPFVVKHRPVLHLLPTSPSSILDVGAGTGADAAWFASCGHKVLAVEPTTELRVAAAALHPLPAIEWLNDSLPGLSSVLARRQRFDAIMLTAVWMHLDSIERGVALSNLAMLLAPAGVLALSIRHGAVPTGRRMFEVSREETIALAKALHLHVVLDTRTRSVQAGNRATGVTWTRLAFRWKASPGRLTSR